MSIIQKANHFLDANQHIGILLLRIFVGLRLFYGVIDNVLSWEKMMEFADFLAANNFPFPIMSAIASVYIQLIGSLFLLIGFKIRLAAFLLVINFIIALLFVHFRINDSVEGMTPALAMLFGCLTLLFTGAQKISLDSYLLDRK